MKIYTQSELLDRLRLETDKTSQRRVADSLNVAPQYINDVLGGRRLFSAKLALRMGFSKLDDRYVQRNGGK